MSVVGMRRFGKQKAKGRRIWVTSIGLKCTTRFRCIFGSRGRTSVYFAFAPTDIKCYFAHVCKPCSLYLECECRLVWFRRK